MKKLAALSDILQVLFIGIDVHLKSWHVCIRDQSRELSLFTMKPDPDELIRKIRKSFPQAKVQLCYEAGFCGFSLYRALIAAGLDCMVVHPADIPSTQKEKQRKSDSIDCRKLARELAHGSLRPVYVPSPRAEAFKQFVRRREVLVKDLTRSKNRIKQFLAYQGRSIPLAFQGRTWSHRFVQWLETQSFSEPAAQLSWESLLRNYRMQRDELKEVLSQLRQYIKDSPELHDRIYRLQSTPGMGLVSAMTFVAEIGQITRFQRADQLNSYAGLIPTIQSSGEHSRNQGITRRCNRRLRRILIEAAWVAVRKDPQLRQLHSRFRQRMHGNKAITAVARHLLMRLRHVWMNEEEYRINFV